MASEFKEKGIHNHEKLKYNTTYIKHSIKTRQSLLW